MTQQETIQFIARLRSLFPASYARLSKDEIQKVVSSWYTLYKDFPNEVVLKALEIYTMENDTPFAPAPGQLHAIIRKQLTPKRDELENKYEAWDSVVEALRVGGYYHPDKGFDSLSKLTQLAVGGPRNIKQWAMLDYSQLEYVKHNFLERYQELYEVEQDKRALPAYTLESLMMGEEQKKLESGKEE